MNERDLWAVYDPSEGVLVFDTEREARAWLDAVVERLREQSGDGWHEDAEHCALYRMVPVARLRLEITARAEDDTDDGARCREAGWDYFARGVIVEAGHE